MSLTKEDLRAIQSLLEPIVEQQKEHANNIAGLVEQQKEHTKGIAGLVEQQKEHTKSIAELVEQQQVHTRSIVKLENNVMHELKLLNENLPDVIARREQLETISSTVEEHDNRIFALEQKAANK